MINLFLALVLSAYAVIDLDEQPVTRDSLLQQINNERIDDLDDLTGVLNDGLLINFVLMHGVRELGPRGHDIEDKDDVRLSADPELPRTIIWDERSGTTISYNGGEENRQGVMQTHGERLDVLTFDHQSKTWQLDAVTFPNYSAGAVAFDNVGALPDNEKCTRCHGPRSRPIFSMYPDWPSFYGSDNDELLDRTKRAQRNELEHYTDFKAHAGQTNPRYANLYSEARVQKYFNRSLQWYPSFPYRPVLETNIEHPSRAFAYRPGLRLGILYNRLNAISIAKEIRDHDQYQQFAPYFLFNLLQCQWGTSASDNTKRRSQLAAVKDLLKVEPVTRAGNLLDYRQNLSLFGLEVRDVDIRFSYGHPGYTKIDNADVAEGPMDVGYYDGDRYYNSYFDGSATFDELLAYLLYDELQKTHGLDDSNVTPRSLVAKYGERLQRMALDRVNFEQMDDFSQWIPIRYPQGLGGVHHREGYPTRFAEQHSRLCRSLVRLL